MPSKREELLKEAIKAEINMAELYKWYAENFTEDREFWGTIAEEERKHASLIRLAQDVLTEEKLAQIFVYDDLDKLKQVNRMMGDLIQKYGEDPPSKEEAYKLAADMESGSFESFYQKKMTDAPESSEMDTTRKNGK